MADPTGFMTTPREVAERRPVAQRVEDWNEVYPGTPGIALLPIIVKQAGRCMDYGIQFFHNGCPLICPIKSHSATSSGHIRP